MKLLRDGTLLFCDYYLMKNINHLNKTYKPTSRGINIYLQCKINEITQGPNINNFNQPDGRSFGKN